MLLVGCKMSNPAWDGLGSTSDTGSGLQSTGADTLAATTIIGSHTAGETSTATGDPNGTTTGASSEPLLPDVCAGEAHSCALREGVLWCWGSNRFGQVGSGTWASEPTPVVVALDRPAIDLACGAAHTCVVLDDHTVWCWGDNGHNQLGFSGSQEQLLPRQVTDVPASVRVATGGAHTCALASEDGSVWCWGDNRYSASGTDQAGPTTMTALANVVDIAMGDRHGCAHTSDDKVLCWGANDHGQTGVDPQQQPVVAAAVPVEITEVEQIYAGATKSCARKADGTIWCWGSSPDATADSSTPVQLGTITDARDLALGARHSCTVRESGSVVCYGDNDVGQKGDSEPLAFASLERIAAGREHTCAMDTQGGVWCFGRGDSGQLGRAAWYGQRPPTDVSDVSGTFDVVARGEGTCEIHNLGSGCVTCWGRNTEGRLRGLDNNDRAIPEDPAPQYCPHLNRIDLGADQACIGRESGEILCWGANDEGQLADGTQTPNSDIVVVQGLGDLNGVSDVILGDGFACAHENNTPLGVWCWGHGDHGELGNGANDDSATPVSTGLDGAHAIAPGAHHVCAYLGVGTNAGHVYCWGRNDWGQLGDQSYEDRASPVRVVGSGFVPRRNLAAGEDFTCSLAGPTGAEELWCWGSNREGQFGVSTTSGTTMATKVADVPGATWIAAGDHHLCLVIDGIVSCTGANDAGQLGDGSVLRRAALTPVTGLTLGPAARLALGSRHSCVVGVNGQLQCFGSGYFGQLGEGTIATDSAIPGLVTLR